MKKYLPIIILTIFSCELKAEAPPSYKGLLIPPLPPGHKVMDDYIVNPNASTKYGVSELWFGKQKMWWLKKMISRDEKGRAQWKVISVSKVPIVPKGYSLIKGFCKKEGVLVPAIIAAAKYENKQMLDKIFGAWRVNLKTLTIEPYPTSDIVCINESFGV